MDSLSISRAWEETKARVAEDGRLFVAVALAFLVLPQTVLGAFSPTTPGELTTIFLILLIVALLAAVFAQVAIVWLAIPPASTVGGAIGRAVRRLLPLLVALLVVFIATVLVAFVLVFVILATGLGNPQIPGTAPPAWAAALLIVLMLSVLAVFQLLIPIAAAEEGGPFRLLARAWRLGVPNYWRLALFLILVWIGMFVLWISSQVIAGVAVASIFGPPEPASIGAAISALIVAVVQAGWTIVTSVMLARIYLQLAGRESPGVTVPKSGT